MPKSNDMRSKPPYKRSPTERDPALGKVVGRMRLERDMSQEDLAHAAGISVVALARLERGKANPTWATVLRVTGALQVPLSELVAAVERER